MANIQKSLYSLLRESFHTFVRVRPQRCDYRQIFEVIPVGVSEFEDVLTTQANARELVRGNSMSLKKSLVIRTGCCIKQQCTKATGTSESVVRPRIEVDLDLVSPTPVILCIGEAKHTLT